jgi:rhodanese-related sulfurtransferase
MLADGGEIAVVDVRQNAAYARGHLLLAVSTPLDGLARLVLGYVPRHATRTVLCDDGGHLAGRAAGILDGAGYDNLFILEGGVGAWAAAGHELFETNYAVANCLGLYVQEGYATPRIDGAELRRRIEAGAPLMIVDSRPFEDFHAATVPGALNVPLAELIQRIGDLLPDPETQVVVHCGGKTRGILGAQSLINADLENPVMSLDEGTMDWVLAGGTLEEGAGRVAGPASEAAKAGALRAAEALAARFAVRRITPDELDAWRGEADRRTLYLIDVRGREEYEAGHLPGSRWIPGGQLASCVEDYLATRGARLCLVDDDGARAVLTASWMVQAGWPETAVLAGGLSGHDLVSGPDPLSEVEAEAPHGEALPDEAPDEATVIASYRQSIEWRSGLLAQFERDGTLNFPPPPPTPANR